MNIEETVISILEKHDVKNMKEFKDEINSYGFIEIIMEIEDAFGIQIGDEYLEMDKMSSLENLIACIEAQEQK